MTAFPFPATLPSPTTWAGEGLWPQPQDLTPLLNAQSVAIVGLNGPERFGGRLYLNLHHYGYPGAIYGVNPRYSELYNQPCYPTLSALPALPDLAVLAVPNEHLLTVFEEAATLGIRAAFIPSSAYSESATGQTSLQAQLAAVARRHKMVVCGPNCMGFHAFINKLVISGYPIAPDTPAGQVAFITHSGSVFDALWQNRRGLHFNFLISSGNEMVTTLADYMQFALTQPSTRVIGLFMETVRDPQTFVAALRQAAEREVPVVVLKVGRTERGAQLALAHSGALAGQDSTYDALFAHYGVRRVKSLDEMLDTLELFAAGLRPPTRYIASLHDSGGERGLLADLAEAEAVPFAPLSAEATHQLAVTLDPGLAPINPLDAWGTGNDYQSIYRDCLLALDANPLTGLTVFAADLYPSDAGSHSYSQIALAVKPRLTKPLVFLANLTASVSDSQSQLLRAAGIPVLMGTETGLRAIKHLLDYAEFQRERHAWKVERRTDISPSEVERLRQILQTATAPLDEFTSGEILRAYGIPVANRLQAASLAEALNAAESIQYPVVLKTAMGTAHKSEAGGVHLNLTHAEALTAAYQDLEARLGPRVLVQQMATGGVELMLGLVNDEQFGLMLALGLGGVFVEVLKDVRWVLLPASTEQMRAALLSLRGAALLNGVRGQAPVHLEAVIDVAQRLSALATDLGDLIEALDLNPVIASSTGAMVVDALVVTKIPNPNL